MAEMAFRQDQHHLKDKHKLGWLAQPFLPTRTTFLRRIEMLKGEKRLINNKNSAPVWLARASILAIATVCIGLRMPTVDAATSDEADEVKLATMETSERQEPVLSPLEREFNSRMRLSKAVSKAVSRFLGSALGLNDKSAERLRSIAIAMHGYHDANGHLPAASIVADGSEHPHSWRIAILPFIDGGDEIYNNYKFDEAWNSEHNQSVTKEMPELFRHCDQDDDATNSSVFVLTGPGTLFETGSQVKLEDVPRLATTLLVFEAKRDNHWAEPVDIEFDKTNTEMVDSLMEQLLGYSEDAVMASKADASTVPLSVDEYDAETLRAMIVAFDD